MRLILTLLVAAAPLEITVLGDAPTRVSVVRADGGVVWAGSVGAGVFQTTCLPGTSVRVEVLDGGLVSELPLEASPTDLSCEVDVLVGEGAPTLFARRRAVLPAGVTVQVLEPMGALELTNGTEDTFLAALAPHDRGCAAAVRLRPHTTARVPLATFACPALQPSSGIQRRVVTFERVPSAWPARTTFEREFDFTATPAKVLFPTVRFHKLRSDRVGPFDVAELIVAPTGERACACAGQLVGSTPHVLVLTPRGLCGRPVDAGMESCEPLFVERPEVGDFPELSPPGRGR